MHYDEYEHIALRSTIRLSKKKMRLDFEQIINYLALYLVRWTKANVVFLTTNRQEEKLVKLTNEQYYEVQVFVLDILHE